MIYLLETMVFHSKLPVNHITAGHLFARLIRHRGSSLEIGWETCFSSKYCWKFTANNGPASNYIDSNFDFARHVHFTSEKRKYQQHPRIGNFHHQNIPKWWFSVPITSQGPPPAWCWATCRSGRQAQRRHTALSKSGFEDEFPIWISEGADFHIGISLGRWIC